MNHERFDCYKICQATAESNDVNEEVVDDEEFRGTMLCTCATHSGSFVLIWYVK